VIPTGIAALYPWVISRIMTMAAVAAPVVPRPWLPCLQGRRPRGLS
jgi:hypothetical protein